MGILEAVLSEQKEAHEQSGPRTVESIKAQLIYEISSHVKISGRHDMASGNFKLMERLHTDKEFNDAVTQIAKTILWMFPNEKESSEKKD